MEDLTELLKGVLEGCVLTILARGESYGYQIVRSLNGAGFESVSEGTVYPILVRLEAKDLVTTSRVPSTTGPPRKVYTLNDAGRTASDNFWQRWDYVSERLAELREEDSG
jgi:DNA-binding PadR family transcriptional regulator